MLRLPSVTLACADTRHHALAVRALSRSCAGVRFARVAWFTCGEPPGLVVPEPVERVRIPVLTSRDDYSRFVLKELAAHITTPHVLVVQWDGYVVHPQAWREDFLHCDYLGARWPWFADGHDVGNGGFSLRSAKLLRALAEAEFVPGEVEDVAVSRTWRARLESVFGIRYGTSGLADAFSFEATLPTGQPFGFHGLFNFCRVVPPAELAALAATFGADIAASPQCAQLLRNCVALSQWPAVVAIATRMLELGADTPEARSMLEQGRHALARGTGVGRNDPCPCGSGKRYKACHGALQPGAGSTAPTASPIERKSVPDAVPADAWVARGIEAHRRGALGEAAVAYRAALAVAPDHAYALHYLGVIDYQQGRAKEALPSLQRSVAAQPDEPEFPNNLGLALMALDRDEEAEVAFRRALALRPGHAGAWNNLGLALRARNRPAEAVQALRQALGAQADFSEARWNLALALLAEGRFEEGWAAYEARLRIPAFAPAEVPTTPRWDGSDPAGRTLLLVAEQGLGDAIHFARFASDLDARGARVVMRVPGTLADLMRTVPGVDSVSASDEPLPAHDAWLPLLSVCRALRIHAVPSARVPYLRADPRLREQVRGALDERGASLRVGLAWAGNARNTNDRHRSIALAALAPLLALSGIAWFSLQKDDAGLPASAIDAIHPGLGRLPWRNHFGGLAAMIDELDLVVCVDTSVAHLAGALARPAFVLLPFAGDWRWGLDGERTAWYPTLRLFRQRTAGDWPGAISALRRVLEAK